MAMSLIWTAMVGAAILCGLATGNGPAVARGALDGAAAGVELCLSMMGVLCLWNRRQLGGIRGCSMRPAHAPGIPSPGQPLLPGSQTCPLHGSWR